MTEKSNALKTLGLELTSTGIKAAKLSFKQGRPQIDQLFHFYFDLTKQHIHPFFLKDEERAFLDFTGKTLIVTSMDGNETLVRPLEIKLKKEKDIDAVLMFQAEPLLPYPTEAALLDRQILSQSPEGTLLTILAIKKEHLQRHLEKWKLLELEPEVVTATPSALVAFSNYLLSKNPEPYFILHLGEEQTCCVFVKEGKLIASKASHSCLNSLRKTYQEEVGIEDPVILEKAFAQFDWTDVEVAGLPMTREALKNFAAELEKVVFSLMKQTRELSMPPLLVTGEGAGSDSLIAFLLKDFRGNLLPEENSPTENFSIVELKTNALTIGEALTALPNYNAQVNFLQEEFAYPHPWRRLTTPLLTFLALSLGLALAFYLFSQAYIKNRENIVRSEYAELLAVMHKSYPAYEQELIEKFPSVSGENGSDEGPKIPPLESLSQGDISFRAALLQKELQAIPDIYPLSPNIPKVSDFLAWLASHPNVVNKEGGKPYIEIEGINYSLFKRPEVTKKQEKYQVRVEIDFTSANATAAREFHDALLAPNNFIDPKGEVKWTNNKGRYKATFFLKDKTAYP